MATIRLSKTAIGKYEQCPRCFWLKYTQKLDQPEGISSKVWKGIEREQIAHHERHRHAGTLPPELVGQVPSGSIFYQPKSATKETPAQIDLKSLRYWGKGLRFTVERFEVSTALDDMLQREEGGHTIYNVWDDKTKSKATDEAATMDLYQTQADVFDLAANLNGYPTDGRVFFGYWYPAGVNSARIAESTGGHGSVDMLWRCQVIELRVDHERIKHLVVEAGTCLEGPMPAAASSCEFCQFVLNRHELQRRLLSAAKPEATATAQNPT